MFRPRLARSYDLDEAAHVADGLHRPAVALNEPGPARHEALPPVQALARSHEAERDRGMSLAERAGRLGAQVLGIARSARERDRQADLRDRESVARGGRIDRL